MWFVKSLKSLAADFLSERIECIDFTKLPSDLHGYIIRKVHSFHLCENFIERYSGFPGIYRKCDRMKYTCYERDRYDNITRHCYGTYYMCKYTNCCHKNTRWFNDRNFYDMPYCHTHGPRMSIDLPAFKKLYFDDRFDYRWVNMGGYPVCCEKCDQSIPGNQSYYHLLLGPRIYCVRHDETNETNLQCKKQKCRHPVLAVYNYYTEQMIRCQYCLKHFSKRYNKGLEEPIILD